MFKKVYVVVVHRCKVVLRWINNFLKNVSWGALHFGGNKEALIFYYSLAVRNAQKYFQNLWEWEWIVATRWVIISKVVCYFKSIDPIKYIFLFFLKVWTWNKFFLMIFVLIWHNTDNGSYIEFYMMDISHR